MPCKGCAERRQIVKTAYQERGALGVIATVPRIIKHTVKRDGRDGTNDKR